MPFPWRHFWHGSYDKAEAARLLVDVGVPVDAENKNGMTPLMMAANRGNLDIVQAPHPKGASVTKTDFTVATPQGGLRREPSPGGGASNKTSANRKRS